ncbi:MAG: AAA family ATPase [Capsulimonadaceae bacterium]
MTDIPWIADLIPTIRRLNTVKNKLKERFTGRDRAIELLALASVSYEHLLLVGPPGTAKTELIQRYTSLIDARSFHYLLTRFTEPSEMFGPLDLKAFQEGRYEVRTANMLPEAEIVFLDEVFQGSSAILNALLTLLNERVFFNGPKRQHIPLISMIGATNAIPEDPSLLAFADRFVLRLEVTRVTDEQVDDLLDLGWELERDRIEAAVRAARKLEMGTELPSLHSTDFVNLHSHVRDVDLSGIREEYTQIVKELRGSSVDLSDRRAVRGLKLIAAAALLRESARAEACDFWPLLHLWSRPQESDAIQSVLKPRLSGAEGSMISAIRPAGDILAELVVLESREKFIHTDAGWAAHLSNLNVLRREMIGDHPTEDEGRKTIDQTIHRILLRLEEAEYV